MLFVLIWGCRPSEAAWMVCESAFVDGSAFREFFDADMAATCPTSYNKTRTLYKWPVPKEMEWAVELLRKLHGQVPELKEQLGDPKPKFTKTLSNWYSKRVLKDAAAEYDEVAERDAPKDGEFFGLRTIRAYHGELLCRLKHLSEKNGTPPPFNYLQHKNWNMTRAHYWDSSRPAFVVDDTPASTPKARRQTKLRQKQEAAAERALSISEGSGSESCE